MSSYRDAGVDIDAKMNTIRQMSSAVKATHTAAVLAGLGAFGGCFDLQGVQQTITHPVLVASTDGIGTKTMVAAAVGQYQHLGFDLVNHCINDILCQGATPLFFMDYIAAATLDQELVLGVVSGLAQACQAAGIALLGGETAEMPGVYQPNTFDVAGTIVGVVSRDTLIDGTAIQADDVVLALPASGLHTNGYSLARKVCEPLGYTAQPAILAGRTIAEALLEPHRSYLADVQALRTAGIAIHGLVHITGGGIWDNIPRVVPPHLATTIVRGTWPVAPICQLIVEQGQLDEHEAHHVLNMGLGMLVIVPAAQAAAAQALLPALAAVGHIVPRDTDQPAVRLVNA